MKHAHHLPQNQNPYFDCSGEHHQQHPREYGGAVGWWGVVGVMGRGPIAQASTSDHEAGEGDRTLDIQLGKLRA